MENEEEKKVLCLLAQMGIEAFVAFYDGETGLINEALSKVERKPLSPEEIATIHQEITAKEKEGR